jgi:hypothetical protein
MKNVSTFLFVSFSLAFLFVSTTRGYSQHRDSVLKSLIIKRRYLVNPTELFSKEVMPNSIAVVPQLTQKLPKNMGGFEAFKLLDGMTCITPDSLTKYKLRIIYTKR